MAKLKKDQFLWTEKYRPSTVKDCILPEGIKNTFQKFVNDKQIPNLLLVGPAGTGKTSIARAMLDELKADYIIINASNDRNIDTIRNTITNYASTVAFFGGRKYIILDEADYSNKDSFQPALRHLMEKYAGNCGFILTANFPKRLIPAIHSRCSVIDFTLNTGDKAKMAGQFFKRVKGILDEEKIKYEDKVVAKVVESFFPDWRRILNELQRYGTGGEVNSGILSDLETKNIKELIGFMKDRKKFDEVRKWVAENLNNDSVGLFRTFYDNAKQYFTPNFIPALVVILARYQYQASMVADQEINAAACLIEILLDAEWL